MSQATLAACAAFYLVPVEEVLGRARVRRLVRVRAACAYVMRYRDGRSWSQIAKRIGRKDHTTAMHLVKVATKFIKDDPQFAGLVRHHMEQPKDCREITIPQMVEMPKPVEMPDKIESPAARAFYERMEKKPIKPLPSKYTAEQPVEMSDGQKFTLDYFGRDICERRFNRSIRAGSKLLLKAIEAARMAAA